MSPRTLAVTAAASLALALSASSQTLGVGDPAPRIQVAEWLQGEPVTAFEKGKPYVVEFWATWCGPCKVSIPHIDELARKHADAGLTVIGVSVWERDVSKVRPFFESQKATMTYRVARDHVAEGSAGFMAETWMQAAGQSGIPAAFIVDRAGRVAWIGHPMEMDEPLSAVVAGTWDLDKAVADAKAARELERRMEELNGRMRTALEASDFKGAVVVLDEMMALDRRIAVGYAPLRLDLLLRAKDYDNAYAWARKAVKELLWEEAGPLNGLAWTIADPSRTDLERRDLDLALMAAERADVLTRHVDPNVLDTLARVHFLKGNLEKAVEVQEKAVANAGDPRFADQLSRALEEYKKALQARAQGQ